MKTAGPTYSAQGKFEVQWKSDGGLRVVDAPMMRGRNPFLVCADNVPVADLIDGADRITDEFFAAVGAVYKEQFFTMRESDREQVEFPVVALEISVTGTLDETESEWSRCSAKLTAEYMDLEGVDQTFELERDYEGLPADPHPMGASKTVECFTGWEINGHPDPNCSFGWTGCACTGTCCTHIVQRGRKCYDETCAWGWLWLQCGCHRNNVVPCPDCV